MNSPYPTGTGPYQDLYKNRTIFAEEEQLITQGYKFLGWNPSHDEVPEYAHCLDEAHNYHSAFPNAWKNVQHNPRGSDCTYWCTKCRIYWKIDMSD